jgi:hypothetical protein
MKSESCQRYLEDPEANPSHPETCAECAFFAEIGADVSPRPVAIEALPLAPWEGARHRAWPLVLGIALALLVIAAAVFAAAGTTPAQVMRRIFPNLDLIVSTVRLPAPGRWSSALRSRCGSSRRGCSPRPAPRRPRSCAASSRTST